MSFSVNPPQFGALLRINPGDNEAQAKQQITTTLKQHRIPHRAFAFSELPQGVEDPNSLYVATGSTVKNPPNAAQDFSPSVCVGFEEPLDLQKLITDIEDLPLFRSELKK
jgi:hypothetical protein